MATAARPQIGPRAGTDYSSSLIQFLDWFQTDEDCARYLAKLRWDEGFSCPRCGPGDCWLSARGLYICSACQKNVSVLVGTIFEKTRLPLLTWFRAIWFVTMSKGGRSAKELQRELGCSYHAAWLMLHKMRIAMKRPGRDESKLTGDVEVDESYLGGLARARSRGQGHHRDRCRATRLRGQVRSLEIRTSADRNNPRYDRRDAQGLRRPELRARLGHLHGRSQLLQGPRSARLRAPGNSRVSRH